MTDGEPSAGPQVHLEFLVEPFVAGDPGPHVDAAIAAVEAEGIAVDAGPFADVVAGSAHVVTAAVAAMLEAAFTGGATRVSAVVGIGGTDAPAPPTPAAAVGNERPSDADLQEFLAAVRPVVRALGATVERVGTGEARSGDIALTWRGREVGMVRPTPLTEALNHLIGQVEGELGGSLTALGRTEKQQAVAVLHERGAFALRRSTDVVAAAMGVSRITIYNYLNALETSPEPV